MCYMYINLHWHWHWPSFTRGRQPCSTCDDTHGNRKQSWRR